MGARATLNLDLGVGAVDQDAAGRWVVGLVREHFESLAPVPGWITTYGDRPVTTDRLPEIIQNVDLAAYQPTPLWEWHPGSFLARHEHLALSFWVFTDRTRVNATVETMRGDPLVGLGEIFDHFLYGEDPVTHLRLTDRQLNEAQTHPRREVELVMPDGTIRRGMQADRSVERAGWRTWVGSVSADAVEGVVWPEGVRVEEVRGGLLISLEGLDAGSEDFAATACWVRDRLVDAGVPLARDPFGRRPS